MTVLVMTLRADSGYSLSPGQCYRSCGHARAVHHENGADGF
jgi:hypothetical protein